MLAAMNTRRTVTTLGLTALLVLDLALVAWVVWPDPAPPATAVTPSAGATATTSPSPSGSSTPSASPTPTDVTAAPLRSLIVASTSSEAWAAASGACGKPATISTTSNGGEDWSTSSAPGTVTRLKPSSTSQGYVLGGDAKCRLRLWTTADAGETWSDPGSAAKGWARNPLEAREVHTPRDELVRPCGEAQVYDLSPEGGSRASVLCAGGLLRTTSDNGDTWSDVVTRKGAVALSGRADGTGLVAVVDPACAGTLVQPYAGTQLGKSACVEKAVPASGRTSVSTSGRAIWLLTGRDVWRTKQLGGEWVSAGSIG